MLGRRTKIGHRSTTPHLLPLDKAPAPGRRRRYHNDIHRLCQRCRRHAVGSRGGFDHLDGELAVGLAHSVNCDLVSSGWALSGGHGHNHVSSKINCRPITHTQLGPESGPRIGVPDDQATGFADAGPGPLADSSKLEATPAVVGGVTLLPGGLGREAIGRWRSRIRRGSIFW